MKRWKRAVALGVASAMLLFNLVAMAVEADELSFASAVVGENSVQDSGWTPPKIDLSVELDLDAEIVAITVSTDHYTGLGALEFILNYPRQLTLNTIPTVIENLPNAEIVLYAPGQIKVIWVDTEPASLTEQTLFEINADIPHDMEGEWEFYLSDFVFADVLLGEEVNTNAGNNSCVIAIEPSPPETIQAVYGAHLFDVPLPEGWNWSDALQPVGDVGIQVFEAIVEPMANDTLPIVKQFCVEVIPREIRPVFGVVERDDGDEFTVIKLEFDLLAYEDKLEPELDYEIIYLMLDEEADEPAVLIVVALKESELAKNYILTEDVLRIDIGIAEETLPEEPLELPLLPEQEPVLENEELEIPPAEDQMAEPHDEELPSQASTKDEDKKYDELSLDDEPNVTENVSDGGEKVDNA